jgi:hypothetical protein
MLLSWGAGGVGDIRSLPEEILGSGREARLDENIRERLEKLSLRVPFMLEIKGERYINGNFYLWIPRVGYMWLGPVGVCNP